LGHVTDIIRRQFGGDNFVRAGINTEVQLAPAPRRANTTLLIEPFAFAVNLQAGAIDKQRRGPCTNAAPEGFSGWRVCSHRY
jgi:hypothetical protein